MSSATETRLGLDIGGTKVHGVLVGPDRAVLAEIRLPTRHGQAGVLASALEAIDALGGSPISVGIGIPGLVEPATGTVAHAVNLGITEPHPLAAELSSRLGGLPVSVENDVNAATLGTARALEVDDVVLLSIGTGLAAGLFLDGHLRRGPRGAAGEIGHLTLDPNGPRCECGQRGCLELYASGSTLSTALTTILDDPAHAAERARFVGAVSTAVRVLVQTVEPAVVVLGGGVASVGAPFLGAVAEELRLQAKGSAFLDTLHLADRLRLIPDDIPVAAVGAALLDTLGGR